MDQKPQAFSKAVKRQAKLKIGLTGPSGSGKTFSALKMASGMGGEIALIDTENKSASLYADEFDFDCMELDPPYTVAKYVEAIDAAVQAGYDILIVDSITHQWAGEGGILSQKEQMDSRGGNSYANWGKLTPEQEKFKSAILHSDIHMICTMRSKQDYQIQEGDRGSKSKVVKLGMAPIQREGMEYEFALVLDLAMNHTAVASKTRIKAFDDKVFVPSKATGQQIMRWLHTGQPVEKMEPKQPDPTIPPRTEPVPQKKPEAETESAPPAFDYDEEIPDFNSLPDERPNKKEAAPKSLSAVQVDIKSVGEMVMPGGIFAGQKIKDAWNLKTKEAIVYAEKVKVAIRKGDKTSPMQLMFVDFGVAADKISGGM